MERQRESTLEVLKRLQAKNKRPIPSMYEKPPVKYSVEDIIDAPITIRQKPAEKIVIKGKNSEFIELLNQIKSIEKQLKSGKSYFDHYYDLRKIEDKLYKLYEAFEDKESLPEDVVKKIKEIKRKFKFNK